VFDLKNGGSILLKDGTPNVGQAHSLILVESTGNPVVHKKLDEALESLSAQVKLVLQTL
jgi:hypothetical protein